MIFLWVVSFLQITQASSIPEQIHIAYAGQSANGYPNAMAINWFTQDKTATSTVRFGLSNTTLTKEVQSPIAPRQYLVNAGYHHSVIVPGLSPATVYYYQVGDATAGWSDIYHFTSASDVSSMSYNLAVFGDMGYLGSKERPLLLPPWQGLEKNWSAVPTRELLERMRNKIDMLLLVGDISYADDAFGSDFSAGAYEKVYNGYMNWFQNLSSVKPWMVTVGNHESECHSPSCLLNATLGESLRNFTAYNARFTMPSATSTGVQNMWYSYNLGPVHWVSVNSETDWPGAGEEHRGDSGLLPAGGFAPNGTYLAWLENDLKQAANPANRSVRPWILAYGHRPFPELNTTIGAMFRKYGVDMYFAGHSHSYSRSGPMRHDGGGSSGSGSEKIDHSAMISNNHYHYQAPSCTYIVIGSAGCDEMKFLYDPKTKQYIRPSPKPVVSLPEGTRVGDVITKVSAGYLQIINGSAINFTLYNSVTNEVLDTVFITK